MRFYLINAIVLCLCLLPAYFFGWMAGFLLALPYIFLIMYDRFFSGHPLYRNYPISGRFYKVWHYASGLQGQIPPYTNNVVKVIQAYAKGETPYSSFGARSLVNNGCNIRHSIYPRQQPKTEFSTAIGGKHCKKPYNASLFNISALSFGSITTNAIETLSRSAAAGNFYYNTGEAGLHSSALAGKGDLVWQVGTGYFGCRTKEGMFCDALFEEKSQLHAIKMIEIKLSQGSKPALGGFLPAKKVTTEIAELCGIEAFKDSILPTGHSAFSSPQELLAFIQKIRRLSGYKPVGIKLCVGTDHELETLISEMKKRDVYPDFITVDSSDGGTGAAPVEYQDTVGVPLWHGLQLVDSLLKQYALRDNIKIIASGKISVASDIFLALAHGADLCLAARPFMIAMGCIQALSCESGLCPSGITSSHYWLNQGVSPGHRAKFLTDYHAKMLETFGKLLASCGLDKTETITLKHILKVFSS